MFGVLAILVDIGCSVGPWIVSFVSSAAQRADASLTDGAALKVGLGFGNLFPLLSILGLVLLGVFRKSAVHGLTNQDHKHIMQYKSTAVFKAG